VPTKCPSCGNSVNSDQKFCTSCGTKLTTEIKVDTSKVGSLKKCPSCGAFVPSLQTKCTECGLEFRETGVSSSVQNFFNSLTDITNNNFMCGETDDEKDKNSNRSLLRVFLYIVSVNIILLTFINTGKNSLSEAITPIAKVFLVVLAIGLVVVSLYLPIQISERNKRKMNLIETFPIPNTKEDIFEFLILSLSQIHSTSIFSLLGNQGKEYAVWNNVWKTKIKQTYSKAKLTLSDDPESISKIKTLLKESKII
jgi:hypothetical protein